MRISRIYTSQPLMPDSEVILDAKVAHYLVRVLKIQAGDSLVLFNGDGSDYAAELLEKGRSEVTVHVRSRLPAMPESPLFITLVQAIGKGDRMDYSLQKATELGVGAIRPLFTERTEVRLQGSRLEKRLDHWRAVLVSACEQSGRARIPVLHPPKTLQDWLTDPGEGEKLALVPSAEQVLAAVPLNTAIPLSVAIGPEGGFSKQEESQLQLAGVRLVSLGPRVLRTETAGPAALTALQVLAGDLGSR